MEAFFLKKVVQMFEEVVVGWQEVRWILLMMQNFVVQSTFEMLVVWHAVWHCSGEELGFSVDQCWLQVLQFSMHLIDLMKIFVRYNGFARIQKAVVDQTSSRPPNSDHDLFLVRLALGNALELLFGPTTGWSSPTVWKWKVKVKSLSRVQLFATLWTTVYRASPSMGFSRQEYRSGLLFLL